MSSTPTTSCPEGQGPIDPDTFPRVRTRVNASLRSLRELMNTDDATSTNVDLSCCTIRSACLLNSLLSEREDANEIKGDRARLAHRVNVVQELTSHAEQLTTILKEGRAASTALIEAYDPDQAPWNNLQSNLKFKSEIETVLKARSQAAKAQTAVSLATLTPRITATLKRAARGLKAEVGRQLEISKSTGKSLARQISVANTAQKNLEVATSHLWNSGLETLKDENDKSKRATGIFRAVYGNLSQQSQHLLRSEELYRVVTNKENNELDWGLQYDWDRISNSVAESIAMEDPRMHTDALVWTPELASRGGDWIQRYTGWKTELSKFHPRASVNPSEIEEAWSSAKGLISEYHELRNDATELSRSVIKYIGSLNKSFSTSAADQADLPKLLIQAKTLHDILPLLTAQLWLRTCSTISAQLDSTIKPLLQGDLQNDVQLADQYTKSCADKDLHRLAQIAGHNASLLSAAMEKGITAGTLAEGSIAKGRAKKYNSLVKDLEGSIYENKSFVDAVSVYEESQQLQKLMSSQLLLKDESVDPGDESESASRPWEDVMEMSDEEWKGRFRKEMERMGLEMPEW